MVEADPDLRLWTWVPSFSLYGAMLLLGFIGMRRVFGDVSEGNLN